MKSEKVTKMKRASLAVAMLVLMTYSSPLINRARSQKGKGTSQQNASEDDPNSPDSRFFDNGSQGKDANASKQSADQKMVFFSGDSICGGYKVFLKEALEGGKLVTVHSSELARQFPKTKPGPIPFWKSSGLVVWLETYYRDPAFRPDILLLNTGIHDRLGSTEQYVKNLTKIIEIAKRHDCRLVWVNTTPVNEVQLKRQTRPRDPEKTNDKRIRELNEAAQALMSKNGIPVIDLYSFVKKAIAEAGPEEACFDFFHHKPAIRKKQGESLASSLLEILSEPSQTRVK